MSFLVLNVYMYSLSDFGTCMHLDANVKIFNVW